jgi:hypothetical protein
MVTLPFGVLMVVSGCCDSSANSLASSDSYFGGSWSHDSAMATRRSNETATPLPNNKVRVAAGAIVATFPQYPTASAELYDPVADTWSPTAHMSTARYFQTATLLSNSTVLVTGGSNQNQQPLATAEVYTP